VKKICLLAVVVLAFGASGAWAKQKGIGIGVEYVFTYGSLGALNGFAITGSPPGLPVVLGANFGFGSGYFNLGVTGDWWLYQRRLTGPLGLYAGPGLFLGVRLGGTGYVALGARGALGLQLFPIEPLELFIEAAVNVGLAITNGGAGLAWGVPVSVGGRFWF
jgi:hypothetical protein